MKAKLSAIVLILTVFFAVSGISYGHPYNPPPSVYIDTPAPNTEFIKGDNIYIKAIASDNGCITKVKFYANGTLLHVDNDGAPYEYTWNTVDVPAGIYTLKAKAYDNGEKSTYSAPVVILLSCNSPPSAASGGESVFLETGEYWLSSQDLFIQGRVLPVQIIRTYGSCREHNYGFGYGWDMNYNISVHETEDPDIILLYDGENRKLEYTLVPSSNPKKYTAPSGYYRYDFLVENQDDTHTLYRKHGVKLDFDTNGKLSTITDRNNNTISFEYTNGLLTAIEDDLDRKINLTYNEDNLLYDVNDFAGRTWTYTYDPCSNDLLSVEGPTGLTTSYSYESPHLLETITDPNGQIWLTNYYDSNMVEQQVYGEGTFKFSYNPDSNEATVTDRKDVNSVTVYNDLGCPLSRTIYTKDYRPSDPDSYTTCYERNSEMEITKKIFPAGNYIDYEYDPNGNLLCKSREPNNGDPNIVTRYTYELKFNFVEKITDARGYETIFDYNDLNGNLEEITFPEVNTPQGPANPVVGLTYNSFGQVETMRLPDGIVIKGEYGNDQQNDPNNYGRLVKTIYDANESDPCSLKIATEFKYDIRSNVIEVNDPCGNITEFAYNAIDKLTKITDSCGYVTNFFYNNCKNLSQIERERENDPNQIIKFTYDILDHIKTITDPCDYVTKYSYDKSENLSDVNDAEENNIHYEYDERDLLWKVTGANNIEYSYTPNSDLNDIKDARDNITGYHYDGFGRLLWIQYPDDTNEVSSYDKSSNVTSKRNRKSETIYYEYDALDRLIVKNRPGEPNITFLYDISGRVVEVNDSGDLTTYAYDRIGRIIEVNDIESRIVKYEYDDLGRRTELAYPDDSNVTYEYDALSRLRKVKYNGDTIAEYEYDELSRRILLSLGNDANAVYDYDIADKLEKLTNNFNGSGTGSFDYTHDKVGNRLTMTVDDTEEHKYDYDVLYQLTEVNYPAGWPHNTVTYSYDALGNRKSIVNGGTTNYSSNNLNQYTSVGGTTYSYDDNGNLADDGTYLYYYDCENRLTDVNDKATGDPAASYIYDYLGQRVSKTQYATPATQYYVYDGAQVIAEYDGDTLLRKFIYGPGIDEPICMIDVADDNKVYYYHFDGLGSVIALTDTSGTFVEYYEYDVFGQPTIWDASTMEIVESSTVGNPYMFTARRYDDETGLYYYRARYYDPYIGRFLQTDPIGYYGGLNLYTYCWSNSINWVDPHGLLTLPWTDKHRNRNEFNKCPRNEPKNDKNWKKRGKSRNWFHSKNNTYEGQGPYKGCECCYDKKTGQLDTTSKQRGTYNRGHNPLDHLGDDLFPHLLDPDNYTTPDPTKIMDDDGKGKEEGEEKPSPPPTTKPSPPPPPPPPPPPWPPDLDPDALYCVTVESYTYHPPEWVGCHDGDFHELKICLSGGTINYWWSQGTQCENGHGLWDVINAEKITGITGPYDGSEECYDACQQ